MSCQPQIKRTCCRNTLQLLFVHKKIGDDVEREWVHIVPNGFQHRARCFKATSSESLFSQEAGEVIYFPKLWLEFQCAEVWRLCISSDYSNSALRDADYWMNNIHVFKWVLMSSSECTHTFEYILLDGSSAGWLNWSQHARSHGVPAVRNHQPGYEPRV